MLAKTTLLLLVGSLNAIVALAVLSRSIRRPMNLWFFALATASAAWVFGIAGFLIVDDPASALNWAKFYYVAPLCIVAASVAFARVFPSGGKVKSARVYLILAGLLLLASLIILRTDFLFGELIYHPWGKEIVLNRWPYLLYSVYLLTAFVLTLIPIYRKTKTERGVFRSQAAVFFDGYALSCILGVFFNLFLPWLGYYQLIWLGPLGSTFYVVLTAYGIIRHRLFDVRIVAARAVGYLLSILALASLYGVLAYAIITLVLSEQTSSVSERAVSAALAVALALTFRPIKRFFDRITNKLFYRDAYDTQTLIDHFNHALVSTIDLDELLKNTSQVIQSTLKIDYCAIVVGAADRPVAAKVAGGNQYHLNKEALTAVDNIVRHNADKRVVVVDRIEHRDRRTQAALQTNNIALVGAISTNDKQASSLGYLVLGPKKSGYTLSNQDVKAMEVVLSELVIAIQNSLRFEEIERFNVTLQEKVNQATRKLRHTNERLRELDQTKDDFISMASHQLRTPLTSVKGYVSMVLDGDAGKITALQRKLLNQSFISSQRMVYLIADLLNVSRLKTGRFVIESVPTNLAMIIKEEVEQLVETAKGRSLELMYHKPEHFPTLMLDETKLRQVIMNFIDNAIYYTPSGGKIEVALADKPQSIEFTVTDNGMGVPAREQHHLFTKFFRAVNAKRARPDGTGLGLFMAKKVIIAQGGAVIFRSKEGKGSTFGFTFPKEKLAPPPKAK